MFFFHLFLTTTNVHPMDLLSLFFSRKAPTPEEQAHAFIKEFPLMTFKNAHQRYKKCSLRGRATIRNHFAKTNDELLQQTFRLATDLPPEIHNAIAFDIFESNQALSMKFLLSPIKDSYLLYAWAKNAFEGKEFIPSSFQIKSINLIFKLSDYVKRAVEIVENHQKNPSFCVGNND